MKRLLKYLTPFAPDQSGAVSVLYEMGGLIVICDAGGCTGNICGFDEPRWFEHRSAVFSAGLRDMDAILGRDEKLAEKLIDAAAHLAVKFICVIGTPVPAVIATDYTALAHMIKKRTNLPVMTIDTNGMDYYDAGEEKAWLQLFKQFADGILNDRSAEILGAKSPDDFKNSGEDKLCDICGDDDMTDNRGENVLIDDPDEGEFIGILGMTPQNLSCLYAPERMKRAVKKDTGLPAVCYGMGDLLAAVKKTSTLNDVKLEDSLNAVNITDPLNAVKKAGKASRNIVVSPSALAAAKYLNRRFGTPYEVYDPTVKDLVFTKDDGHRCGLGDLDFDHRKILIVHQQVRANTLRNLIRKAAPEADIDVRTWFMLHRDIKEPGDARIDSESAYIDLVENGHYDIIFADACLRRMTPHFEGLFLDLPHFALSGRLEKGA